MTQELPSVAYKRGVRYIIDNPAMFIETAISESSSQWSAVINSIISLLGAVRNDSTLLGSDLDTYQRLTARADVTGSDLYNRLLALTINDSNIEQARALLDDALSKIYIISSSVSINSRNAAVYEMISAAHRRARKTDSPRPKIVESSLQPEPTGVVEKKHRFSATAGAFVVLASGGITAIFAPSAAVIVVACIVGAAVALAELIPAVAIKESAPHVSWKVTSERLETRMIDENDLETFVAVRMIRDKHSLISDLEAREKATALEFAEVIQARAIDKAAPSAPEELFQLPTAN